MFMLLHKVLLHVTFQTLCNFQLMLFIHKVSNKHTLYQMLHSKGDKGFEYMREIIAI